jgi:hypothetical protein
VPCPYKESLFRQQDLPATRPFLTPLVGCVVYGALAIISFIMGGTAFWLNKSVFERDLPYADVCGSDPTCTLTLDVPSDVHGPIYVYYRLTNFYQSTFLYSASRNWDQLRGKPYVSVSALDSCLPLVTNSEDRPYVPCGLLPHSIFNDTFEFPPDFPELDANDTAQPKFQSLFAPPDTSYDLAGVSWLNADLFPGGQEDDRFVTWLEIAPFSEFRKLWAQTDASAVLKAGQYNITVANNFPVAPFGGAKSLVIAQVCWIGGQNSFFGIAFFVVSGLSAIFAIVLGTLYICKGLSLYKVFEGRDTEPTQRTVARDGLLVD